MKPVIRGVGVVGGFGCGIDALTAAATRGECSPGIVSVKTETGHVDIPAFLADTSTLEDFTGKKALRRIDRYSRMALLGSFLALQDAGITDPAKERMGVIIATGYGASRTTFTFLDSFIKGGDSLSSPTHFSSSVHNAAVAHVSMLLGITGPGLTISQFGMSVPSALLTARCWLHEEMVDSVLFGAVDEYCDVLGYCRYRFFGDTAGASEMNPLDLGVQSAIPGEGATFFVLSRGDHVPGYALIEDIHFDKAGDSARAEGRETSLFLAADGHRKCAASYGRFLSGPSPIACYTPLYGSLPTGQAFDMAIAALAMKRRRYFASPVHHVKGSGAKIIGNEHVTGGERIACVKSDGSGWSGFVTIGSSDGEHDGVFNNT